MRVVMLLLSVLLLAACGGSGSGARIEGTYSNENGSIVLDLRSGGQAALTLMGESRQCTYAVERPQLTLDCKEEDKLVFTIHDDGSLTGPPGSLIGALRKK